MQVLLKVTELKAAAECAGTKDIRCYLNGVCLDFINDNEVMIIGTNGPCLFACKASGQNLSTDFVGQIIIPIDTLKSAVKMINKKDCYIPFKSLEGGLYQLGEVVFKAVDGKFPDYRRVIPKTVSGDNGQFAITYLTAISKAMIIYSGMGHAPALLHNGAANEHGTNAAVMVYGDAICVIMPMRNEKTDYNGFVIPEPKQEEAA